MPSQAFRIGTRERTELFRPSLMTYAPGFIIRFASLGRVDEGQGAGGRVREASFLDLHGPRRLLKIGPPSIGAILLHNLVEGRFTGPIFPDNPNYTELGGIKRYATVARLAESGLAAVR